MNLSSSILHEQLADARHDLGEPAKPEYAMAFAVAEGVLRSADVPVLSRAHVGGSRKSDGKCVNCSA